MSARFFYPISIGLSVIIGIAFAVSVTGHFLVHALSTWQTWMIGTLLLSALSAGFIHSIWKRLIYAGAMAFDLQVRLMLLILSFLLPGLFMAVDWLQPKPIVWVRAQSPQRLPYMEQTAWNEKHWGVEVHATINNDPHWPWRAHAEIPQLIKRFGGTLQVLVTQPEWAVFDSEGNLYQGGDGLELRFVVEQDENQKLMQHLDLNLHVRQEQRRWKALQVSVPANIKRLSIEALPGPPGSNNWYDRVWVSIEGINSLPVALIRLADWLSLSFLVCTSTVAIFFLLRVLQMPWLTTAVSVVAVNLIAIFIILPIGEIYLRGKTIQPYVRTFPAEQNENVGASWVQVDSRLGWVAKHDNNNEINPQGFRDSKDFASVDQYSAKIRVMILGDSFMLGAGVSASKNVPSLLQAMLGEMYEVFNFGMGGWGIDQMYLAYHKYKDVIRPHVVILAFIDDDVDRVLEAYRIFEGMSKPSFTIRDDKLVFRTSISRSEKFLNALMSESVFFSLLMRQIFLLQIARPIVEHVFLTIAQEARRGNREFVVVRIPTSGDIDLTTRISRSLYSFKGTFKSIEGQYLEPLEEIIKIPNWNENFYLRNDGHMSVTGNKYLAEYIYKRVFENFIRSRRPGT